MASYFLCQQCYNKITETFGLRYDQKKQRPENLSVQGALWGGNMERSHLISGTPKTVLPIRVRGVSTANRFFDEQAETSRVTQEFIVARIHNLVDLDVEIHITNLKNELAGNFRVVWINTRGENGAYPVGLELLESDGEIWGADATPESQGADSASTPIELECKRCHERAFTPLPEAENEAVGDGFMVARPCDTCKSTTYWLVVVEAPTSAEPATASSSASAEEMPWSPDDKRAKGRAPIKMLIQVIRQKYEARITDLSETLNVSRTGVYFLSHKEYEVGEWVEIIVPYHPDSVAIPVPARVVRKDHRNDTYKKGIALQLTAASQISASP